MRASSNIDPKLQRLESEMQKMAAPYINDPARLSTDLRNQNNTSWSVLDHLEYVFHVNLELIVNLHTLPDSGEQNERKPTMWGHFLLLTGIITDKLDQRMADYEPGHTDRDRNFSWLREHFQFWNDKLAGLHFLPDGWQDKVLNQRHPTLGRLNGSDWLRIMYLFTRYHRRKIEKIKN